MGRLKGLSPRVAALPPRIGYAAGDEKGRDAQRAAVAPWRSWYSTARWQKLRMRVWVRDQFICKKTGVLCVGKYPADNSPVADHIIPHRGDERLFWDIDNIQTVSKAYHDSIKQSQERSQWGGGSKV